jgi:hypothetical protein
MKTLHLTKITRIVLILVILLGGAATPNTVSADSTIIVETNSDNLTTNSFCSLREAITNANNNNGVYTDCEAGNGNDTIVFSDGLANATIVLTSFLPTIDDPDGLTIQGLPYTNTGAFGITISGNNLYQVFLNTQSLVLDTLIIKNGSSSIGGGITKQGTLIISNSIITENKATLTSGYGGGIYNSFGSILTIRDSIISENSATGFAGGIYNGGIINISNSTVSNNTKSGLFNDGEATAIITNSIFTMNSNIGALGGGVYNNGKLTITDSTFSLNTANVGGGIYSGNILYITGSTFHLNTATVQGGGVYFDGGTGSITNSTFASNTANQTGGGVIASGNFTITNSTFSANNGGGVYVNGNLKLNNTILANGIVENDCFKNGGASVSGKHNLIENDSSGDNACGTTAPITSDPNLGSLTGSPAYFPLNTGSPAIDAGDNAICAAAPVNNQSQNGVTRPQGTACDIGSYEATASLTVKSAGLNDGWVLEHSETSNTGGTMNSAATTITLGDDAVDRQYRAILHFDTSSLPDTAVVTNMTLKIKQQGNVVGVSPFSFGSLYVDMRNPAFGNSILELVDFSFAAKKVKPAVFNPNPVSGWFSARFNMGGKLYVNRTGITQLRLYFSVDDNNNNIADFIRFYSGNASAGNRPKFLITYYVP